MLYLSNTPQPDSVTGIIISLPSSTFCVIKDTKGRAFNAVSNGSYTVGQSVLVKNGIVVGKAKSTKIVKHFNV